MMSLLALSHDLSVQEALSGIFGSVSLATWIFLLVRHTSVSSFELAMPNHSMGGVWYWVVNPYVDMVRSC